MSFSKLQASSHIKEKNNHIKEKNNHIKEKNNEQQTPHRQ